MAQGFRKGRRSSGSFSSYCCNDCVSQHAAYLAITIACFTLKGGIRDDSVVCGANFRENVSTRHIDDLYNALFYTSSLLYDYTVVYSEQGLSKSYTECVSHRGGVDDS